MKKLIVITGPFASGKSSVIEELSFQRDFFYLSYDKIKRFFSYFDRKIHKTPVKDLMFVMAKELLSKNFLIVLESKEDRIIQQAITEGYEVLEFAIDVSVETAVARFRLRLEQPKNPRSFTANIDENSSEERFIEKYYEYKNSQSKNVPVYSSESMTPKEIANDIAKKF